MFTKISFGKLILFLAANVECGKFDLVFALDTSVSVGSENWVKMNNFMLDIINALTLSEDDARVSKHRTIHRFTILMLAIRYYGTSLVTQDNHTLTFQGITPIVPWLGVPFFLTSPACLVLPGGLLSTWSFSEEGASPFLPALPVPVHHEVKDRPREQTDKHCWKNYFPPCDSPSLLSVIYIIVFYDQVGVLTFGNVVYRWVDLNWFLQKADLVSSVSSLPYVGEQRNISGALWYAREMMFQLQLGDRPDARNIGEEISRKISTTIDHNPL